MGARAWVAASVLLWACRAAPSAPVSPAPPAPSAGAIGAGPSGPAGDGDDTFAGCKDLWVRGRPDPLRAPPARTPGRLRVVPDPACPAPSGWAGIGLWRSMQLAGFSADGRLFVDGCALLRAESGAPAGSICPDDLAVDGTPLAQVPEVARRLRALGAPAPGGRWPRDDLFVRWSVTPGAGITYELRSDSEGGAAELASFPGERSMPFAVVVSPDGRWLALVDVQPNGDDQVRLLSVDAVTGRLRR